MIDKRIWRRVGAKYGSGGKTSDTRLKRSSECDSAKEEGKRTGDRRWESYVIKENGVRQEKEKWCGRNWRSCKKGEARVGK